MLSQLTHSTPCERFYRHPRPLPHLFFSTAACLELYLFRCSMFTLINAHLAKLLCFSPRIKAKLPQTQLKTYRGVSPLYSSLSLVSVTTILLEITFGILQHVHVRTLNNNANVTEARELERKQPISPSGVRGTLPRPAPQISKVCHCDVVFLVRKCAMFPSGMKRG